MKSKIAFVKQDTNWICFLPIIIFIGLSALIFYHFDKRLFIPYAFMAYYFTRLLTRGLFLPPVLYTGTGLIKKAKLKEAIPYLQKSSDFYAQHTWIDRYRFILLISFSKKSFWEISTCNLAYCLLYTGRTMEAKEIYEEVLSLYTGNLVAAGGLTTISLIIAKQTSDKIL